LPARLADIQAAVDAIRSHLQRGDLSDGLEVLLGYAYQVAGDWYATVAARKA